MHVLSEAWKGKLEKGTDPLLVLVRAWLDRAPRAVLLCARMSRSRRALLGFIARTAVTTKNSGNYNDLKDAKK